MIFCDMLSCVIFSYHFWLKEMCVKKGTNGMSFKSIIGPSQPISEIVTSHVCRLKKTRNEGDQKSHFFNQESEGTVS